RARVGGREQGREGSTLRSGRGGARAAPVTAVTRVKGQARAALPTWRRPARRLWRASRHPRRGWKPEPGARPPRGPRGCPRCLCWRPAAARLGASGAARLYRAGEDAVWVLDSGSVRGATANSSAAWLVQFYSSWCGHCIGYAPTWRALAGDVRDWAAAIRVAVLDCAEERNHEVCRAYDIHFYPTFRYFKAFTKDFTSGENFKGPDRELQTVRQTMIDFLQNHTNSDRPPACPPLGPAWPGDLLSLFDNRAGHYVAILVESNGSYIGREVLCLRLFQHQCVTLDLIPYENIVVKRVLDTDKAFLERLSVSSVPSCYLIHPNGSQGPLCAGPQPPACRPRAHLACVCSAGLSESLLGTQQWEDRMCFLPPRGFNFSFWKTCLGHIGCPPRSLRHAAVLRSISAPKGLGAQAERWEASPIVFLLLPEVTAGSKLYMADLESGLHYLLRVELAAHQSLAGAALKTLKDFVTVLAKLFPGRPPVRKLLETLQEWLANLPLDRIPYNAILDLVNNKMRISGIFLMNHITWVGCQGSLPELRGYTCSLWKLFHTLTVQAGTHPEVLDGTGLEDDPQAVLQAVRRYIRTFFGCKECGDHFEEMAEESMDSVKTPDQAILWLWRKHNVVNSRLAGHLGEDPKFPKVPWPTPDLCPACHEEIKGLDSWNEGQVLLFLKRHYSSDNLVDTYAADLGDASQGVAQERGRTSPERPRREQGAKSLRPPSVRPPRPGPSVKLGSLSGAAGSGEVEAAVPFLGSGFSSLDVSLCVVLYVASSLFLMVMYFFFRVRSKRWRVRHHPAV
ncbi:hypothetical protein MC885_020890, partial [Smutsia gigantea]